jgi:hypothetical protein
MMCLCLVINISYLVTTLVAFGTIVARCHFGEMSANGGAEEPGQWKEGGPWLYE